MRYPNSASPGIPSESFEYDFEADTEADFEADTEADFEADFEFDFEDPDEPPAAAAFRSAARKMDVLTQGQLATARGKAREAKHRFQKATRDLQQARAHNSSEREFGGSGPVGSRNTSGRWVRQGRQIILFGV